jgi:ribonuclease VapC
LIAVDSSALVAIFLEELHGPQLLARLAAEDACILSAANYVEAGQVLAQRKTSNPRQALAEYEGFLQRTGVVIALIDEEQARVALEARIRYGRGFGHPARLNYSDCFAYALTKVRNLPLLFLGDDFTHTDIVSALP